MKLTLGQLRQVIREGLEPLAESVVVYPVDNVEAARKYSRGTRWGLGMPTHRKDGSTYFDDYVRSGCRFIFVVQRSENGPAKRYMALIPPPSGEVTWNGRKGVQWFDERDAFVDPKTVFTPEEYDQILPHVS